MTDNRTTGSFTNGAQRRSAGAAVFATLAFRRRANGTRPPDLGGSAAPDLLAIVDGQIARLGCR